MKYERLTKYECGDLIVNCKNCEYSGEQNFLCTEYNCIDALKNRLAELEDKIENGTLIDINDNIIGETVFGIQQDTTGKYHFDGASNTLIGFTSNGIVTWNDIYSYNDYFIDGFWFFTREEAEAKLKELKG